MSSIALELYTALQETGVKNESAKRVANAVDEAIDKRFAIHAKELATHGDIETVRKEIAEALRAQINWLSGLIIAVGALIIGTIKWF